VKPKFLLDEHVDLAIQRGLRRREPEIEVLRVRDPGAPPAGTLDPDILIWLEDQGYILVTENRSTIPDHLVEHFAAGRHIPGIFWIRPHTSIGRVTEELFLVWSASNAEEYFDRTLFIPL
jgi:hypothetical protein